MPLALNSECFKPLLEPMSTLPGIGEKQFPLLSKLCGGERIIDLLLLLPHRYLDRNNIIPIGKLAAFVTQNDPNIVPVITGEVLSVNTPPRHSRAPTTIRISDDTGQIDLVMFNSFYRDLPKEGSRIAASGPLKVSKGKISMVGPSYIKGLTTEAEQINRKEVAIPSIEPIWPLTAGIQNYVVSKAILKALPIAQNIPEWIDDQTLKANNWPSFFDALSTLQHPHIISDCDNWKDKIAKAHERLAADELLADQLCLQTARHFSKKIKGLSVTTKQIDLQKQLWSNFPYKPTQGQKDAIHEILDDLKSPYPMMRLLQGDVGSGKTMVALTAMAFSADAGFQSALMTPTEILAKQHYTLLAKLLGEDQLVLLTGSTPASARKQILADITSGKVKFIVGTHALFQAEVKYKNLALAIIDEQHRFGVEQRETFSKKGNGTNTLLMSATPIPRTLQISQWGGIEISRITEKPGIRIPTQTTIHSINKLEELVQSIQRALNKGEQVFWVCPLVEESDMATATAVEERFKELAQYFPKQVGLAHGKQTSEERTASLESFKHGKTKILVATTVIEVGVDIPNANIIVIEHAENFGLAQLHQLRGRVGRGDSVSHCLLLYGNNVGEVAIQRLNILRNTDDGFLIADEDFKIRGGGEAAGTKQAGINSYRIAELPQDIELLEFAKYQAEKFVKKDPSYKGLLGQHLSGLMHLFNRQNPEKILFGC